MLPLQKLSSRIRMSSLLLPSPPCITPPPGLGVWGKSLPNPRRRPGIRCDTDVGSVKLLHGGLEVWEVHQPSAHRWAPTSHPCSCASQVSSPIPGTEHHIHPLRRLWAERQCGHRNTSPGIAATSPTAPLAWPTSRCTFPGDLTPFWTQK